jgi:AICAR transformylase/IMP cyclohydrolase PurH
MLRSTAKNHAFTCIVTSPNQYGNVQEEIVAKGGTYDKHDDKNGYGIY